MPDVTPSPLFEGFDWDGLIQQIVEGRAIPILGPALVQTEHGPLHELLLARLHARYPRVDRTGGLRRFVQHVLDPDAQPPNAPGLLHKFLRDEHLRLPSTPPTELRQLAEIDFSLYVSLTSDNYLTTALRAVNKGPEELTFHSQKASSDLATAEIKAPQTPTVYRLFSTPNVQYPWTDEDVLEYMYKLQGNKRLKNLFSAFKQSYLLFLGCDFPDWLMRMFVRLITGKSVSALTFPVAVLDGASPLELPLSQFLRRSKQVVLPGASAAQFVAELHRRWSKRRPVTDSRAGHVFLSFIRMDRRQAEKVHDELQARHIPVWYDRDPGRLAHGGSWREELVRAIESSAVFIPFISSHTCSHVTKEAYRLEWNHALRYTNEFSEDYRFIRPIVIDPAVDIKHSEHIPDPWRDRQVASLSALDYDALADDLRAALEVYARRFST